MNVLPELEPDDSDRIMEAYLMFLLMGEFVENSEGNSLAGLRNTRGETFQAFWSNITRRWNDTERGSKGETNEDDCTPSTQNIYDLMRQQFQHFKKYAINENHWVLGDIAEFWDEMKKHDPFRRSLEKRMNNIRLLHDYMSRRTTLDEEKEKELIQNLKNIFKPKRIPARDYEDSEEDILSILALALSRLR